jgi:hypothetical protein
VTNAVAGVEAVAAPVAGALTSLNAAPAPTATGTLQGVSGAVGSVTNVGSTLGSTLSTTLGNTLSSLP